MRKHINYLSIGSSVLILIYTTLKLFGENMHYNAGLISYSLFTISFIFAIIFAFKQKFLPIIIQTLTLAIIVIVPPLIRTEINFYVFKEDREEIIRMLAEGELQKDDLNDGFAFYYTPEQFKKANKTKILDAAVHSKDQIYVFFKSADPPLIDFVGLEEGFVYSSTGEFPTAKEFDNFLEYKKIDDNWYFVSDDHDRFMKSCLYLCNEKIEYQ